MQYDETFEFGEGDLTDLEEATELIIGAEVEVAAWPPVSKDMYVNLARTGTDALEGDAGDPELEFRLYGATASGGALTELATQYLGACSEIEARKGPLMNMVLPVGVADYPFLKAYIYNMDVANDIKAGTLKAWIGPAPDAHQPLSA